MSNDTLANAAQMVRLQEELAALRAENERLMKQANAKVTVKYTEPFINDEGEEKGGTVSVYGLQRFPVSLRPSQWLKVFSVQDLIKAECTESRIKTETEAKARHTAAKVTNGKA